jgi:hypothetical protein
VYDPAEHGPDAGAPMPEAADGFDSLKQRPYVGIPITSLSLGAPRDTQYSAVQFCKEQSIPLERNVFLYIYTVTVQNYAAL